MISVLDKILILSGTLWVVAVGFVIFSWILQARQQAVLRYIAVRLEALEKKVGQPVKRSEEKPAGQPSLPPETTIAIAKDEPLSKYETVTLPDEIDINFVDRGG